MNLFKLFSICALLTIALGTGCGGDGATVVGGPGDLDDGGILDPPVNATIGGQWATNTTEVLDTCGFDPLPAYSPLLVEESGDSVVFTFTDGFGNCEQSVRSRSGDTVTLTRTDTIDAGCGLVRVQSNITYDFTQDTLTGLSTHQYSVLEGGCANLPCTYQLAIGGTRCDGCFGGCAAP